MPIIENNTQKFLNYSINDMEYQIQNQLNTKFKGGGHHCCLTYIADHDCYDANIIVAKSWDAVENCLKHRIKQYPELTLKEFFELDIVKPNQKIINMCNDYIFKDVARDFISTYLDPIIQYKKKYGKLPRQLKECKYALSPDFYCSLHELNEFEIDDHYNCYNNCYMGILPAKGSFEDIFFKSEDYLKLNKPTKEIQAPNQNNDLPLHFMLSMESYTSGKLKHILNSKESQITLEGELSALTLRQTLFFFQNIIFHKNIPQLANLVDLKYEEFRLECKRIKLQNRLNSKEKYKKSMEEVKRLFDYK